VNLGQLTLPPGYGGPILSFDEMPAEIQNCGQRDALPPAGQYVLRVYKERRRLGQDFGTRSRAIK